MVARYGRDRRIGHHLAHRSRAQLRHGATDAIMRLLRGVGRLAVMMSMLAIHRLHVMGRNRRRWQTMDRRRHGRCGQA